MRSRSIGTCIALGAAFLAVWPSGPLERLSHAMLLPGRVALSFGLPSVLVRDAYGTSKDSGAAHVDEELDLSLRLERAVLRSAWPETIELRTDVVAVPGEALGSLGADRDRLTIRVSDTRYIEIGQPVVAGDAYIGSVDRIPYADFRPDRPNWFERTLRRVGLSSPPRRSPPDLVEVELITGKGARVGGLVAEDQYGESCQLVTGGLLPLDDRIWLAIHNPESRATREGLVYVHEPVGLLSGFDSLAEDFLIGELTTQDLGEFGDETDEESGKVRAAVRDPFATEVRGIVPLVDFGSGLNQVLVLTKPGADSGAQSRQLEPVPVLDDGGWRTGRWLAIGDTSPWRSTGRVGVGRRGGAARGAAVVDGVRLVGRVESVGPTTAAVALLDDPGLQLVVLAQSVDDPDATPLVLGRVRSEGRAETGEALLRWVPEPSSRHGEWLERHARLGRDGDSREAIVRLWTGSGMERVPRGLLVGTAVLPLDVESFVDVESGTGMLLGVTETARPGRSVQVRTGTSRIVRPAETSQEGEAHLAGR